MRLILQIVLLLGLVALPVSTPGQAQQQQELQFKSGFYALVPNDGQAHTYKVKFSDVKFGAYIVLHVRSMAPTYMWVYGPTGEEVSRQAPLVELKNHTCKIVDIHAPYRGAEYTIKVQGGPAFLFTSHHLE